MFYQPIIGAEDGVVAGVEALIRWHHPDRGLLTPAAFLDVTMASDTMPGISAWVLEQATRQLAMWQERIPGTRRLQMAVNLRPEELREPRVVAGIEEAIRSSGVDPSCVVLEITESTLVNEADRVDEMVGALGNLGAILSIDDFGGGHSSIGYVGRFPIDVLKIDMSLIQSLGRDMRSEALCAAIFEMARVLGLKAVAKGVENQKQFRLLRKLGVDLMQGYFLAHPVPADSCEEVLSAAPVRSHASSR